MIKVCLDPGHGGKDPGAIGYGFKEKDLTLAIALEAGRILEQHGVNVTYTRTKDVFVDLSTRAKIANNAGVDSFTSIHVNASTNILARGVETFHHTGSTRGEKLAISIQDHLIEAGIFTADRGVKHANFAVLRLTAMAASLVELGFITNKGDVDLLDTKWRIMAMNVAYGILTYHNIAIKPLDVLDVTTGKMIFEELTKYLNSLPTSEYAIESSKKGIASGLFVDGDKDGLIDDPRGILTREQLAVVLNRAGILGD